MKKNKNKKERISAGKLFAIAIVVSLISATVCFCLFAKLFLRNDKGKTLVEIPNLVGKSIDEVESGDYFGIKIEKEPIFSDKYAEGEIISQSPSANLRRVYRGEDIALRVTVSLGKERLYMPDLVGFDCYEAACVLRELGAVVRFASVYSEGGEHDKVLRTSIRADEEIEQGSRITLFVSRPRRHGSVKVKDYCRLPLSVATQRMMRDGLVLGEVIYAPSDDTADNFVIKQSLFVDSYVKWGSKIDITVADGSCEEVEIETNGEEF